MKKQYMTILSGFITIVFAVLIVYLYSNTITKTLATFACVFSILNIVKNLKELKPEKYDFLKDKEEK